MKLYAPTEYWELSPSAKAKICNGCGAKGGIDVPDTMYGLSVTRSCNIHDYMWYVATTLKELKEANKMFFKNMKAEIREGSWWLRGVRYARAHKYYLAVKYFGTKGYAKERGLK